MPPANRHNPERAKSSQSLYSLHEFQREFGNDEACLEWLWRERHSPDGARTIKERAVVVAAVERGGKVRATVGPDRTHALGTVREFVLPGSMIFTDDFGGYEYLSHGRRGRKDKYQYRHRRINHSQRI